MLDHLNTKYGITRRVFLYLNYKISPAFIVGIDFSS